MTTNLTSTAVNKISLGETDIGCRKEWSHVEAKRFNIHNFAEQNQPRGTFIPTPKFKAHGYDWEIQVYPRGCVLSNESVEYVSCYLKLRDREKSVKNARFVISSGKRKRKCPHDSGKCFSSTSPKGGWRDFTKRSTLLNPSKGHLVDGALIVDVEIQVLVPAPSTDWKPKTRTNDSFLSSLWEKPQDADARIVVQGKSIPAHRLVLENEARQLFDLVSAAEADDSVLTIDDVSHDSFKAVLCYIYTGNLPDSVMQDAEAAKKMLNVADRFGCVELKVKMEYELAMNLLTPLNLVDLFMFADALSCALLKESAMIMFRKQPKAVRKSTGWAILEESPRHLTELVDMLIPNTADDDDSASSQESVNKMTVCGLRKRLECDGLELDGSRDTLIKRLKSISPDENEEGESG